jgi:hypothetical protein
MKSLSTKSITVSRIEPLVSDFFLIFIAFTNSFQILKTWIKSTKNSKSKSVAKEVGCFLKMRSIPDLSLLIVGEV